MNPFQISGYAGEKYFCDREQETKLILDALSNGRNLNLFNIRRIGKTSLINHVFKKLSSDSLHFFVDISQTENQQDLIKALIDNLSKKLDRMDRNFFRKMATLVSSFGASVGFDELSGLPKIELNTNSKIPDKTLDDILALTASISKKNIVIAIDEFQQILSYPEKNTEALFRSLAQNYPDIRFIYCGSSKSLMEKIFANPNAPFYQSTEHVSLGYIQEEEYLAFAKRFLPACSDAMIIHFLEWTRRHTYYTQFALNRLYQMMHSGLEALTAADVELEILLANKFYYDSVRKLVTADQWKILKAIASNEPVLKPLSQSFCHEVGIPQSTVKYNMDKLAENDLIFKEQDGYKIYDVFFGKLLTIKSLDY